MGKKKNTVWPEQYIKGELLGKGGNGTVYKVQEQNSQKEFALKILSPEHRGTEKIARFQSEIEIVTQFQNKIKGILPITNFSKSDYWYTMPIALPIQSYIEETKPCINQIIKLVLELCDTLIQLHAQGITHRDIKPANIYYYEDTACLSDFGLVDFPNKENQFTKSDKQLGAIFTIAPEMKRNPKAADGKKADVYSLAKTIWMLLTDNTLGFDGVYQFNDKSHGLRYNERFRNIHLVELENALTAATQNDPQSRPSMTEFKKDLSIYLENLNDSRLSQKSDWAFLKKILFGNNYSPRTASWNDLSDIVQILTLIGLTPAYNHMMFPDGGGLDLTHAEFANESGCIYLFHETREISVVKPQALYFASFPSDETWNYFFLESAPLSSIFSDPIFNYEHLIEDRPSHYVSASDEMYGVYDYDSGTPLPAGYKLVNRYCKGNFLIVFKLGPYNRISSTYDGRHGGVSFYIFSEYISNLQKKYSALLNSGAKNNDILALDIFSKNPFKESENSNSIQPEDIADSSSFDTSWCFKDALLQNFSSGNAAFYITLQQTIVNLGHFEKIILCKDGFF